VKRKGKGHDKETKKEKDKRRGMVEENYREKDWIKGNKKKKDKPEPTNKVTHEPKEATRDKVNNFEVFSCDPKLQCDVH